MIFSTMFRKSEIAGLTVVMLCTIGAKAQPGTVIFHDDFGTHAGRVINEYAATANNAFVFADPNTVYPLPIPPGAYTSNNDEWQRTSKDLQNNHYAVVTPKDIYTSVGAAYTPYYNSWNSLISYAKDATGMVNGAVMAVNAGTTPGILYKRPILLQRGKYYKLTYYLWVESGPVQLRTNMHDASGTIGLGLNLGLSNGGGAGNTWLLQTQYFYLPASACTDNRYTISLQNHALNNSGNDFAIDELTLVEMAASEVAALNPAPTVILAPCVDGLNIPEANSDQNLGNNRSANSGKVIIPILHNDLMGNGTSASIDGQWNTTGDKTKIAVAFVVPQGAGYAVNTITDGQGSIEYPRLDVPGEGVWEYKNDWNGPNGMQRFYVEFTPTSGFSGNPTPIQYTITESYIYPGAPAGSVPVKVTSNPATITVTYTGNPTAVDDMVTAVQGAVVNIPILTNDKLADGATIATPAVVTIAFTNPATGLDVVGNTFSVPGQGDWSYSSTTGVLTFTPNAGYIGTPSPIPYTISQTVAGSVKTASAIASVTVEEATILPVNGLKLIGSHLNGSAQLAWSTLSENNSSYFEVLASADGVNFTAIGKVKAAGTSNVPLQYRFSYKATAALTYYRVRVVNTNGSFSTSNVVAVSNIVAAGVHLFPNPAKGFFVLQGVAKGGKIELSDIQGRKLRQFIANGPTERIALDGIASGTYTITIYGEDSKIVSGKKLVKE